MRLLKAFWLFFNTIGFCPKPRFTDEEAMAVTAFLQSSAGRKLQLWMTAEVIEQNERAVSAGTERQCGVALGYRIFFSIFRSFIVANIPAKAAPQVSQGEGSEDGANETLEHLAP